MNNEKYFVRKHGLLYKVVETVNNSAYPLHEDNEFNYRLDSTWESEKKANQHAKILNDEQRKR